MRQECSLALHALFVYLPLLGFILRSTNIRNAFEVFGPLLRLSRQFLDLSGSTRPTQLLLSSEWDYSPLSYPEIPALPGFVLIGLPASESSNPLLIPLAGHELGHAKWIKTDLQPKISRIAFDTATAVMKRRWNDFLTSFGLSPTAVKPEDLTTNLYVLNMWQNAVAWAVRQSEETFCDCVGVGIFGRSYLEAFAYLLSPHIIGRAVTYPNMNARVTNLIAASHSYGVDPPADYSSGFDDEPPLSLSQSDQFRLEVADETLKALVPLLITEAQTLLKLAGIKLPEEAAISRIVQRYGLVVPAERSGSLSAILNAAWRVTNDAAFWQTIPQISTNKAHVLKELVLKNIEILEIEHIVLA